MSNSSAFSSKSRTNWSKMMLVLSRKKNEQIVINENIVVVVIEIRGNRVILGIIAPNNVKILRAEICQNDEKKSS